MTANIFKPALESLSDKDIGLFGPTSFQDYLTEHSLPKVDTAQSISIDSYERLNPILKDNDAMVLRLGSSSTGTGTQFAVVKVKNRLKDFFLLDDEIFIDREGATFLPNASMRQLFAYQVLPKFSEACLVNLALASGLVSYAIGLDEQKTLLAPATGKSTYTFNLKPHSDLKEKLVHIKGQVEIDAIFVEKRDDIDTIFVLEAKSKDSDKSLSKHKLVYPILAIAKYIPMDMPIIPIYMKILESKEGLHFHVVECNFPDPRKDLRAINELDIKEYSHLVFPLLTKLGR